MNILIAVCLKWSSHKTDRDYNMGHTLFSNFETRQKLLKSSGSSVSPFRMGSAVARSLYYRDTDSIKIVLQVSDRKNIPGTG